GVEDLYLALYRETVGKNAFRAATRLVFAAAAAGDRVAVSILERVGDELGLSGATIVGRLAMSETPFTFVLTGGAFRNLDSALARAAIARMHAAAPRSILTLPLIMPVAGAALLAMDGSAHPVAAQHYEALRSQGLGWHPDERYG